MTTVPPGWYDDGHGGMRWWDGIRWTGHVALPAAAEPLQPDPPAGASPYWGGEPTADRLDPGTSVSVSEPRRPRPWATWVVFGAVGLGLVLAFAFASQLVLPKGETGQGEEIAEESAADEPAADEPAGDQSAGDQPDTPDEHAAVDAVRLYNEAWLTGDCDAFLQTTTVEFRAGIDIPDCAVFADASRDFAGSVSDYETFIRSVATFGVVISVSTIEAYSTTYDDNGFDTGVPVDYEDWFEYRLSRSVAGGWAIDSVTDE